jgi:hypothetical protein
MRSNLGVRIAKLESATTPSQWPRVFRMISDGSDPEAVTRFRIENGLEPDDLVINRVVISSRVDQA